MRKKRFIAMTLCVAMAFSMTSCGYKDSKKVDVNNPELTITIEIRLKETLIYFDGIKGLGGYPVGTLGKGLLMLSGGIDSPVAGYLAIKRGVKLEGIYFESPPHTSEAALNKLLY